jgi:metal-dependent amidase/aminoacylase/carboxypeptidase family protein
VPDKTGRRRHVVFPGESQGLLFCLGAGNDAYAGIHNPRFDFNEDILIDGVETFCRAAIDLLGN